MKRRPSRIARTALTLAATVGLTLGLGPLLLPAPAHAGQVGVTIGIQGNGYVRVVEGSLEDNGSYGCDRTTSEYVDDRVVSWCPRIRNEEPFEAWVWLRPDLGFLKPGWSFARWEGCAQTRQKDGVTECAVHSGAFDSVERSPIAVFDDNVAPVATVAAPQQIGKATFSYRWDVNEAGSWTRCMVDGQWVDPCTSPMTRTFDGVGLHRVIVQPVDASGNEGVGQPIDVRLVQTMLPQVPQELTNQRTAQIQVDALGGATAVQCWLDNVETPCNFGFVTLTDLADGQHTFHAQASAGVSSDRTGASATWRVDTAAPAATIVDTQEVGTSASVWFTAPDDAVRTECRHQVGTGDPSAWATCTSPYVLTELAVGAHAVEVRATDAAGNVQSAAARTEWVVDQTVPDPPKDTTAPRTTVLAGAASGAVLTATSSSYRFGSTESGSTFGCTADGRPVSCSGGLLTLRDLKPGTHVVTARATDAAGNLDRSGVTRWVTVPVPAKSLRRSSGWSPKAVRSAYDGSVLQTKRKKASVTLKVRGARRLALVASTGKAHGKVRVYVGKRLVKTVSLKGAARTSRVIPVASFGSPVSGKVRVVVTTRGRTVRLEGIAAPTR